MRNYRKAETQRARVVSEPNGPIVKDYKYGIWDNVNTRRGFLEYTVAKPYTFLEVPLVEPKTGTVNLTDGTSVELTAPYPEQILSKVIETKWVTELQEIFNALDANSANGAVENSLAYGDLLALVSFAEAGETMVMIRSIFTRLFRTIMGVYNSAKKLNPLVTFDLLSDVWMEYRYGWRPLIADAENLYNAVTRIQPYGIQSSYGTSKDEALREEPIFIDTVDYLDPKGWTWSYEVRLLQQSNLRSKSGFNFLHTESSRNDDWLAILGLDLESLLSTAWDLIPFSFVVDMFINVSSLLKTQNSSEQVDSFNHYRTHLLSGTVELKCVGVSNGEASVWHEPETSGLLFDDTFSDSSSFAPRWYKDGSNIPYLGGPRLAFDYLLAEMRKNTPFSEIGQKLQCPDVYWVHGPLYLNEEPFGMENPWRLLRVGYHWKGYEHLGTSWVMTPIEAETSKYTTPNNSSLWDHYKNGHMYGLRCGLVQALLGCISKATPRRQVKLFLKSLLHRNTFLAKQIGNEVQAAGSIDGFRPATPWFSAVPVKYYTVGRSISENPSVIPEDVEQFSYNSSLELFTREPVDDINHQLTIDTDLSAAQIVDLTIIAQQLLRRLGR